MVAQHLVRAVDDPEDDEARGAMLRAAAFAGIGFGKRGRAPAPRHVPTPVSGLVRDYHPSGYPGDHPIIPHGMSVILNAPAVFRFTAAVNPDRHLYGAQLMGVDVNNVPAEKAGEVLADALIALMRQVDVPNGLSAIGFTEDDIDPLVEGTLPQHRVTKLSPRPAEAADLRRLFADAMVYW